MTYNVFGGTLNLAQSILNAKTRHADNTNLGLGLTSESEIGLVGLHVVTNWLLQTDHVTFPLPRVVFF